LLFVGVGAVEGVSGGGGTAWMLVRPASEDVAGIGVEESFAELMKLRFLKKEETKKRTEENRGNREESPRNSFSFSVSSVSSCSFCLNNHQPTA